MSSLESKIEYNSSNGEVEYNSSNGEVEVEEKEVEEEVEEDSGLNPNYGDCKWCNKAITKDTYKPVSIKPKGRKSYTVKVFCKDCQDHLYPCRNNCGKYLTLAGYIKGHHPNLCRIAYVKSHPHTDIHEKISELNDEIEELKDKLDEMTASRNEYKKRADNILHDLNYFRKRAAENIITPELKNYLHNLIRENVRNRLIYNCNDCKPCIEYYSHKHTCETCKLCKKCNNKVIIYDDSIEINFSNEPTINEIINRL